MRTKNVVEAKINPDAFDPKAMGIFRELYPRGRNYVICLLVEEPHTLRRRQFSVRIPLAS